MRFELLCAVSKLDPEKGAGSLLPVSAMTCSRMHRLAVVLLCLAGCGAEAPPPGRGQDAGGGTKNDSGATAGGADHGTGGSGGGTPHPAPVEYDPPTGSAGSAADKQGPGVRRVLLAKSADSVTFTRLDQRLLDQANTPNMLALPSGRLMVYFTAYQLAGAHDGVGVAVSDDNAASWRFYKVQFAGLAVPPSIVDPDVVYDAAAKIFRLYVTQGLGANAIAIKSLTSTDGFNFTFEGLAFNPGSTSYLDSLTHKVGSGFVQFLLHHADMTMGRGTSTDGTTFTLADTKAYTIGGEAYVLSNWLDLGNGTHRVYAFRGLNAASVIKSFTTTDGVTLTPETTTCLALGNSALEKSFVKDAAVARMANGTYLMAYVSEIP